MKKVQVVYDEMKLGETANTANEEEFKASTGWLKNFMRHNHLSLRRKTYIAQKDPDRLVAKVVACVLQVMYQSIPSLTIPPGL